MQNVIYKRYVKEIFSHFKKCLKVGDGWMLLEKLRGREDAKELKMVAYNLLDNGYLATKDNLRGFFVLTKSGINALKGGYVAENKIELKFFFDLKQSKNQKNYDKLWLLIGDSDKAPMFVDSIYFYNVMRKFIGELPENFCDYYNTLPVPERKREIFYRELWERLPKDRILEFLDSLNRYIDFIYSDSFRTSFKVSL